MALYARIKTICKDGIGTLSDLEDAFWREYGVRVIFRLPADKVFIPYTDSLRAVCDEFDDTVSTANVATWKRLVPILGTYRVKKQRCGTSSFDQKSLTKDCIVIIGKHGLRASGNTKIANIRFVKG